MPKIWRAPCMCRFKSAGSNFYVRSKLATAASNAGVLFPPSITPPNKLYHFSNRQCINVTFQKSNGLVQVAAIFYSLPSHEKSCRLGSQKYHNPQIHQLFFPNRGFLKPFLKFGIFRLICCNAFLRCMIDGTFKLSEMLIISNVLGKCSRRPSNTAPEQYCWVKRIFS